MSVDVTVVTPWYPSARRPFLGAFVASQVRALVAAGLSVDVVHTNEVPISDTTSRFGRLRPRWRRWLVDNEVRWGPKPDSVVNGASLVRVPVPRLSDESYLGLARLHRDALQVGILRLGQWGAVAHAHVGSSAGWAAAELLPAEVPLVITEHYSRTGRVLNSLDGEIAYRQALARAHRLLVVGKRERRMLRRHFPRMKSRIKLLPNVVDLHGMTVSATATGPGSLDRWICVGSIIPLKRPELVLDSFILYLERHPGATLTFVGSGSLEPNLRRASNAAGVSDSVFLVGAKTHAETLRLMGRNQVLVQLSTTETFGMVVAEAVGCGLAVLATRSGGVQDILDDNMIPLAGSLVDVDVSADEVRDEVELLGNARLDPHEASAEIRRRYAPDVITQQLMSVYESARARPRA